MAPSIAHHTVWTDKFTVPPIPSLLEDITPELRESVNKVRASMRAQRGVRERLSWMGIPWRWTLVYKVRGQPARALAYLILDPVAPRLSVPLTADQVCALEVGSLTKAQEDAILGGTKVGSQLWANFQIGPLVVVEDILQILGSSDGVVAGT